jgi:biopolymer transport protein ExbD
MLAYTLFVVARFSRRYYLARRESRAFAADATRAFQRNHRTLAADLGRGLGTLKAVSSAAPFLGLAGATYQILAGLSVGYSGSVAGFYAFITARISAAWVVTLAGIIVAIPAAVSYNTLRMRLDVFVVERSPSVENREATQPALPSFHFAQKLPLKKRFSSLPPLALLAAPALASVITIFLRFEPYERATGLPVRLPSSNCEYGDDRLVVLHIDEMGKLYLNNEPKDSKDLTDLLSKIYSNKKDRTLYLFADDHVPFQTVANAIDIARNSPIAGPNALDLTVLLITPLAEAERVGCLAPVRRVRMRRASRYR